MKKRALLTMGVCLLLMVGCMKQTVVAKSGSQAYLAEDIEGCVFKDYTKTWNFLYFISTGNSSELVVSGTSHRVETKMSFVDGVMSLLTLGLVQPRTTELYDCEN